MQELCTGIKYRASAVVTAEHTAAALGSGILAVFATPAMIALMEKAASFAVQPYLAEGSTSVGTRIDIAHIAATPVGMAVWAEAELIAIERRKLTFRVVAFDAKEKIGEGVHERFIVVGESFLCRAAEKKLGR